MSTRQVKGLKLRPKDPDLFEVFERASWAHALSDLSQFEQWLRHRLALAQNWVEQEWLSMVLTRVTLVLTRNRQRIWQARRRLLLAVNIGCRRDVNQQIRREAAEERELAKRLDAFNSPAYWAKRIKDAEERWSVQKQALIKREEARRERERQGRWLISR